MFRRWCGTTVVLLAAALTGQAADGVKVQLTPADGKNPGRIEIAGLGKDALEAARKREPDGRSWEPVLKVQIAAADDRASADQPALAGGWKVGGDRLVFTPRFPIEKGLIYRVTIRPAALAGKPADGESPVVVSASIPKPVATPTTVVSQVYPTADLLPENQLKFYVHFSAPMSRGDSYRHVDLLDEKGKPIEGAFLEIDEEFWDRDGKRITLLIDPGRIKHGLKPREDLGPVLEEGKKYTLVIKSGWRDAEGNPLKAEFRKAFRAGPQDETPPSPKTWKLIPPTSPGGALQIRFPEALDHALLNRVLVVFDARGREIGGKIEVADGERLWRFTPERPWAAGKYRVEVESILEDLAGNGVNRPFEVDVLRPVPKEHKVEKVTLPFELKPPPEPSR